MAQVHIHRAYFWSGAFKDHTLRAFELNKYGLMTYVMECLIGLQPIRCKIMKCIGSSIFQKLL